MTRSNDKTNIQISNKLWKQLNNYKLKPSDSFEEVIKNLIREREAEGELPQKKHEN
jgi:predicted CopG family antitoxin